MEKSLYAYVDLLNKGRVAPAYAQGQGSVKDMRFHKMQGERSRRLAQWYEGRSITPLRGETGVRTLRTVRQNPGEIIADVALHSALYYEKGGITHREDKIETERLTFVQAGAGWEIINIERSVPERSSQRGAGEAEPALRLSKWGEVLPAPQPSQPLLNRRILRGTAGSREVRYRREEAAAYADRWWKDGNPEFEVFDVDCTNYVSQCLFAGERLSTILVKEKRAGGTKATMEPRNGGASAGLCRTVLGGIWADSAAADSAPKL